MSFPKLHPKERRTLALEHIARELTSIRMFLETIWRREMVDHVFPTPQPKRKYSVPRTSQIRKPSAI